MRKDAEIQISISASPRLERSGRESRPWFRPCRVDLKPHRELRRNRPREITCAAVAVLQTILKLDLGVRREAETRGDIDAPDIMPPLCHLSTVGDLIEKLLVPTQ